MKISTYEAWLELERQDQERIAERYPAYASLEWQREFHQRFIIQFRAERRLCEYNKKLGQGAMQI